MNRKSLLATAGLALATVIVVAVSLLNTRIALVQEVESELLVVFLNRAQLWLGPASVLLFACGVHWAAARRWGRAVAALPALPVWSLVLVELPTWSSSMSAPSRVLPSRRTSTRG